MSHSVRRWLRPPIAAAGLLLAGLDAVGAAQASEVHAVNNSYTPATMRVSVGTTVRFVNDDADLHTVTQKGGGFDSGLLFQGDAWSYTFSVPGTYEYVCLPHPFMTGTITVE